MLLKIEMGSGEREFGIENIVIIYIKILNGGW